jgi:hypothetical protein
MNVGVVEGEGMFWDCVIVQFGRELWVYDD